MSDAVREALLVALDALETHAKQYPHMQKGYTVNAIKNARAALAQSEPAPTVASVTECEACFTPDACQLRGTCDHYAAEQLRVAAPPPDVQPAQDNPMQSLTMQMQQMCSDWNTYWRASDAHGVNLTRDQALELLRFALGVEVEIKASQPAQAEPVLWQYRCIATAPIGEWEFVNPYRTLDELRAYKYRGLPYYELRALYAHQPTLRPLTDAKLAECMLAVDEPMQWGRLGSDGGTNMMRKTMRAIERALAEANGMTLEPKP